MSADVDAVVFDVGRVLYRWDLRHLYAKLIDDPAQLEWFVTHVVTEEWHFEHDAGRPLHEMVAERRRQFPDHAHLIDAYASRFMETIPGPVPGTHEIVKALAERGVPLFALTNFADLFWAQFRPGKPIFDLFRSHRRLRRREDGQAFARNFRAGCPPFRPPAPSGCFSSTTTAPISRRRDRWDGTPITSPTRRRSDAIRPQRIAQPITLMTAMRHFADAA